MNLFEKLNRLDDSLLEETAYSYLVYAASGLTDEEGLFDDLRLAKKLAKKIAIELSEKDPGAYVLIKRGKRGSDVVNGTWDVVNRVKYDPQKDSFEFNTPQTPHPLYGMIDENLNKINNSSIKSKRIVKKKKLTEGVSNRYEVKGKEVTWPEYFEYNMETNDYFMDEQLFSSFYDKAVELVEKEGFTDVFTEPSTQAGRGGDFFWATKDGVSYRGSYDYEEEQEIFYDAAVNSDSKEEAIDNLAKAYAKLIISNLTIDDDYDDEIAEMLTENRNNPYFTPYGYRDAAKVLAGKAPDYYYNLKEIEMDEGDGIKLAKYALRKGLPVMVDPDDDPDYPTFFIEGKYHWNDYFYPYSSAHEDNLVAWDGKMFIEQLTEDSNSVSSQIPENIDAFLQDLAQMYGMIDYKDIMKHEYTEEEIKKLRNYERRFNAEIEYEGDEEADAIMRDIAEKVAKLIKH